MSPAVWVVLALTAAAAAVAVWRAVVQHSQAIRRGPGMTDVLMNDGILELVPRGSLKVLSLHSEVRVPLSKITSCYARPNAREDLEIDFRMGGTGVPGRLTAGTMVGPEGKSFWLYREGQNAIYLSLRDEHFAYLVVEVDEPMETVTEINNARSH